MNNLIFDMENVDLHYNCSKRSTLEWETMGKRNVVLGILYIVLGVTYLV